MKSIHGFEIRDGKFAWRLELAPDDRHVRLIYQYPAGEQTFELPVRLIPTLIAQLRRAYGEMQERADPTHPR